MASLDAARLLFGPRKSQSKPHKNEYDDGDYKGSLGRHGQVSPKDKGSMTHRFTPTLI
jgi:hypothetical protein